MDLIDEGKRVVLEDDYDSAIFNHLLSILTKDHISVRDYIRMYENKPALYPSIAAMMNDLNYDSSCTFTSRPVLDLEAFGCLFLLNICT